MKKTILTTVMRGLLVAIIAIARSGDF